MNWIEGLWGVGILLVVAIFGVKNQEENMRPQHMQACLAGETVTVWNDQWQECFKRYPGGTCGVCGTPVDCPRQTQDPTCVAVEGVLP